MSNSAVRFMFGANNVGLDHCDRSTFSDGHIAHGEFDHLSNRARPLLCVLFWYQLTLFFPIGCIPSYGKQRGLTRGDITALIGCGLHKQINESISEGILLAQCK